MIMKKLIVLVSLFILPIFVYIFFALATHNSLFLEVVKDNIPELPVTWQSSYQVKLNGHITILGFPGKNLNDNKANFFNLNQKVFNKYKDFKDLQLVMICSESSKDDIQKIKDNLIRMSDLSLWKFAFVPDQEVVNYFNSLQLMQQMNASYGTSQVFIIDKDRKLRGRLQTNKTDYRESYNTISAAELHNEMTDDLKILLREYRLALKKNDPNQRKKN